MSDLNRAYQITRPLTPEGQDQLRNILQELNQDRYAITSSSVFANELFIFAVALED